MKKCRLYLDENEWRLIILCLNDFRNRLIAEERYTDCVDELLVKFIHAKTVKVKKTWRIKQWRRQFLNDWVAHMSGRVITCCLAELYQPKKKSR